MSSPLSVGDPMPSFSLKDQHGERVSSDDFSGKNLVIFFYPKDDSLVCTAQACAFRDAYDDFLQYDCEIIGISSDNQKSHGSFASKYNLQYKLLADEGGRVRKLFGVPGDLFGFVPGRVTYVVDKSGTVRFIFNSQLDGERHIREALDFIKSTADETT